MKIFNKYLKGNLSSNIQQEKSIDGSPEQSKAADQMFSKNYWFGGDNSDNNAQPPDDPWLPQMVSFLIKIINSYIFWYVYYESSHRDLFLTKYLRGTFLENSYVFEA